MCDVSILSVFSSLFFPPVLWLFHILLPPVRAVIFLFSIPSSRLSFGISGKRRKLCFRKN